MAQQCLIVEDHPLYAEALECVISYALPELHCMVVPNLKSAVLELKKDQEFKIVILDLCLGDAGGLLGLLELRGIAPKTPILINSAYGDREIVNTALICGAAGFISKAAGREVLIAAVRDVLRGRPVVTAPNWPSQTTQRLTYQQLRILEMICQGLLNKQIAHRLGIYETTVKAHVSETIHKFGVSSRTQAVLKIVRACSMHSTGCRHGTSLVEQPRVARRQALDVS